MTSFASNVSQSWFNLVNEVKYNLSKNKTINFKMYLRILNELRV